MSGLRDQILLAALRDYLDRERPRAAMAPDPATGGLDAEEEGGHGERSLVGRYLRALYASSFRVHVRELWARVDEGRAQGQEAPGTHEAGEGDGQAAPDTHRAEAEDELVRYLADCLLHEGAFQPLHGTLAVEQIARLAPARSTASARTPAPASPPAASSPATPQRRAGQLGRERLQAIAAAPAGSLAGKLDHARLAQVIEAMLEASPKPNATSALMEYAADADCVRPLGTPAQRTAVLDKVRRATGTDTPDSASSDYAHALDEALRQETRQWLTNAGCSLSTGRLDGIRRKKDVPVGLVEMYERENENAREGAGLVDDEDLARDALALYRSLLGTPAQKSYVVVPVLVDSSSASGLYLLGLTWFDDAVLERLFPLGRRELARRAALAAGARGGSQAHRPEGATPRRDVRTRAGAAAPDPFETRRQTDALAYLRSKAADPVVFVSLLHAYTPGILHVAQDQPYRDPSRPALVSGIFNERALVHARPIRTPADMCSVLEAHRAFLRGSEADVSESLKAYQGQNLIAAPEGCPARFLPYFDTLESW